MARHVDEMNSGKVDGLFLFDVNPAYDYPQKDKFISGLQKVGLKVALPVYEEETAALVDYICPDHHFLETWSDAEVKTGFYGLGQPAIRPIFNTRAAQASMLKWLGKDTDYRAYIQAYWENNLMTLSDSLTFTSFWNKRVHDGIFESGKKEENLATFDASAAISAQNAVKTGDANQISLVVYPNVAVGTGKHANNPWLQELPDPVSKACWDNYIAISPKLANELGLNDNDTVNVSDIANCLCWCSRDRNIKPFR